MTLIKSISGIRGTVGGHSGDTLSPPDIAKFVSAYGEFISRNTLQPNKKIVVGRDARITGDMVRYIVCGSLMGMGFNVIDIGLASTPTTEIAVRLLRADGGIIITASHNPYNWNALKLLNANGEFLTKADGDEVLAIAEKENYNFAPADGVGCYIKERLLNEMHINNVLSLPLVDKAAIQGARFRVCVDAINSVGGIILPQLLDSLGVDYTVINGTADGCFAHNPEPLEKNLGEIMTIMRGGGYDLGIVVDPDVDRLAFICEDGTMFGEEYTLVSVADYVLSVTPGNTVSNLSSTRALRDITEQHGCEYHASAVGEVNVTTLMKETAAIIGGEGNGGVIYPESHYGRDALVGIALFLSHLAHKGIKASELRRLYPAYFMAKNRIDLTPGTDTDAILAKLKELYKDENITDIDGVKIDFADKWVHLRKSNTEPIMRIYSEAHSMEEAEAICAEVMRVVDNISKNNQS